MIELFIQDDKSIINNMLIITQRGQIDFFPFACFYFNFPVFLVSRYLRLVIIRPSIHFSGAYVPEIVSNKLTYRSVNPLKLINTSTVISVIN